MGAPVAVDLGRRTLTIRGTPYPVLLPTLRDPRLHLAAVIVSLQVLGQVAFDFRLSIAQILVSVGTCAVLEVALAFRLQRVVMWPASALLTGNGVAFILRVPGTEHGDWWSMNGWWIFAGTAAVSLLSKYLIRFRGGHVFNPSNFGLVLCFLLLGPEHADPLDFWWGPMSAWMVLALAIIVVGGLAILSRLRLLEIAVAFWLAFAAGLAVLAASGHEMTARWHLGPLSGLEFWRVLVFSPEILVFLFFMITDPKTIPSSRLGRRTYAAGIGLLAVLLIAPQTTEYATKVAVLGALAIVCASRPVVELVRPRLRFAPPIGQGVGRYGAAFAGAAAFVGLVVLAGLPARPTAAAAGSVAPSGDFPQISVVDSSDVATRIDRATAERIASDLLADLRIEAQALARLDPDRASAASTGERLAELWQRIDASGGSIVVPEYVVQRMTLTLEPGDGQSPPLVVATVAGTMELRTYSGATPKNGESTSFEQTFELVLADGRYLITGARGQVPPEIAVQVAAPRDGPALSGTRFENVASGVGLDFRHGAFRFRTSNDPVAMMGGGICWIDVDDDGWLDLYAVNSHSIELDLSRWREQGGTPRNALYRNEGGQFVDVSSGSGADISLRGSGCVAADLNGDGHTDLYVTASGYDALLWSNGDGTFTEGARAAGIAEYGWHAGAAVADVNGDGRPDIFVTGYADLNTPASGTAGFPSTYAGVRDLLYLNTGLDDAGRATFREVGRRAGVERSRVGHGLGAVFTDVDADGRLDLYVANDTDPNRLYLNLPRTSDPAGLGFRLVERARYDVVADPQAGMGVAASDFDLDGRPDLFVTNSHRQLHAVFESRPRVDGPPFADARRRFAPAFDTSFAGWGVSWADLDLDGDLDVALANGAIPVHDLDEDAEPLQVLENDGLESASGRVWDVTEAALANGGLRTNGRGLAAADFDNDGDLDLAVGSIGGELALLRSSGATGHWLEVRLEPFSPGARVTAVLADGRRLVRELQAGSSYLSSEDPRAHFGLGAARSVKELVVRYPDGHIVRRANVAAGRIVTIRR